MSDKIAVRLIAGKLDVHYDPSYRKKWNLDWSGTQRTHFQLWVGRSRGRAAPVSRGGIIREIKIDHVSLDPVNPGGTPGQLLEPAIRRAIGLEGRTR